MAVSRLTELTEQLEKVAIRCTSCGKYRSHSEYKTPITAYDDPRKPVCDDCRSDDATKGVIRREPLVINLELTKVAKLRANLEQIAKNDPTLAKAAAEPNKTNRIWNGAEMLAKAWTAELDTKQQSRRPSVREMVKAELSRRRVAATRSETAKIEAKNAARVTKQRAVQAEADLAAVLQEQAEIAAQITELAHRTDAVFARASAAYGQVAKQQEYQAVAELARQDQIRADWMWKAQNTQDPDLRAHFLARAEGRSDDD